MYAVLSLNKTVDVDVYGVTHSVPLSFGIGMIGAIPVFETKDQAESFAAGKFEIAELKTLNAKVSGAGTASAGLPGSAAGNNGER